MTSDDRRTVVRARLWEGAAAMQHAAAACSAPIDAAATRIADAFRNGRKLLLCGNGGSAADCQHMAAEFVSRLTKAVDRRALPAIALTTDTSILTAFANDCGFDGVFRRQVEALGVAGDVLLAITTSGSSVNVLQAIDLARERGMTTVVLTGGSHELAQRADVVIAVPSSDTQQIQQVHLAIEHVLCELVERELFELPGAGAVPHPMFAQAQADERTQLRVNAAVLLRDARGHILLEKRADCGLWGVPGGRVAPGESIADAAHREIREETGLEIRVTGLRGVYSGPADRILSFPDTVVQVIDVVVEAEVVSGDISLSAESEAMEFFPLSALPPTSAIIPPARRLLDDIVNGVAGLVL
jgi:D-sedoheptulose 7-phosphate isomerase